MDLERNVKELQLDFDVDENIELKIKIFRNDLKVLEEDEDFFLKMKMAAIREKNELLKVEQELINKAENNEKSKENLEYQKLNKDLDLCQQKYDIGSRYRKMLTKERKLLLEDIHRLEDRELLFQLKPRSSI